ncbi:MAG: NAD(P)-dependent alcohol dehydrogenase [Mycobacteriales bacterium]
MKAIVHESYGDTDVIEFRDVARPEVGDRDVLVRVRAAGVDRGVWHVLTGRPYLIRLAGFGVRRPKHPVLGTDVSGVVEAVGGEVTRFRPGDEVMGAGTGAYAEHTVAREDRLVAKPANLSHQQAAAVPVSAVTALQALRDQGRVRPGQRVLVIGASGGVGTYAVQLGKALGAEVTGVCSTGKVDLVRSLGADHVIDYTREELGGGPYDLVVDIAGNRPVSLMRRLLTRRGTLVITGGEGGDRWTGGLHRQLFALATSAFSRRRMPVFVARVKDPDLRFLAGLIEAGKVTPAVDRTYSLDQAPEAIRHLLAGHARGKLVLTV